MAVIVPEITRILKLLYLIISNNIIVIIIIMIIKTLFNAGSTNIQHD